MCDQNWRREMMQPKNDKATQRTPQVIELAKPAKPAMTVGDAADPRRNKRRFLPTLFRFIFAARSRHHGVFASPPGTD